MERFTCQQVIEALQATKGMVYLAAERLGCSHQTVYNYLKRHPTVRAAKQLAEGKVGDTAELKLYQAILDGEHWAIAFYLSTKGKDRGYSKRQEITGAEGGPLKVTLDWDEDISGHDAEAPSRPADSGQG